MATSNSTRVSPDLQRLVDLGLHLFPIDHPALDQCSGRHNQVSCDGHRGKHPSCHWPSVAQNSAEGFPRACNVGIACGPSDLVVVDEDSDGHLQALLTSLGQELPPTLVVRTGRGHHHYFRQPVDGRERLGNSKLKNLGADIDIKADGGYVVGPGSTHESGTVYEVVDWSVDIAPLPDWLYDFLIARQVKSQASASDSSAPHPEAGSYADAIEILDKWNITTTSGRRRSLRLEFDGTCEAATHTDSECRFHLGCGLFDLGLEVGEVFTVLTHAACSRKYHTSRTLDDLWQEVVRFSERPRSGSNNRKGGASAKMLPNLPDEFWNARPTLTHIRQAAHSRRRSADVVFYTVLTRLSAFVSPYITVDSEIGGGNASLNFFAAVVGPSGIGKSSGASVASRLLPTDPALDCFETVLGSGEGVCEAFMGTKKMPTGETDSKGNEKMKDARTQVRNRAFFMVDEGEMLTKIQKRSGSTIGPILRTAWTGDKMGQQNANAETTRMVENYSLGMLIGFQLTTVVETLSDIGSGMAQRFVWSSVVDPSMPDQKPAHPGPLEFDYELLKAREDVPITMHMAPAILDELDADALRRAREGIIEGGESNSHKPLTCIKVAGLLAILDGRHKIDEDDWKLAQIVWDTSCAVRDEVNAHARDEEDKRRQWSDKQYATRMAMGAVETEKAIAQSNDSKIVRIATSVAKHVHNATEGQMTRGYARKTLAGRDKSSFEEAVEYAESQNWIVAEEVNLLIGSSKPVGA